MNRSMRLSLFVLSSFFILTIFSCADKCEELREFVRYEPVYIDQAEYERAVSLEAPQEVVNAGVIASYGNFLFINEYNEGIHIINNSDPENPINEGFISINNNKHFAIKDGRLLANRYHDLVAVDIRDANNIREINRVENVFPDESEITDQGIISHYNRTTQMETRPCEDPFRGDWWMVDDIVMMDASVFSGNIMSNVEVGLLQSVGTIGTSTSSSTARFTIAKNHLYVLNSFTLEVFDLANPENPVRSNSVNVGGGVETLFPLNDYLFIGAQQGMSIYDLSNPNTPVYLSSFDHAFACDPVVANESNAYVTLRSGTPCQGFTNQLDVVNIEQIQSPFLVSSHNLTNPRGLTLVGQHLLVCDGDAGIAIFNIENEQNVNIVGNYRDGQANDILPISSKVVVVSGEAGIYQLDISDISSPKLLSFVSVN